YCQQGEQNELLKWQKERLLLLPQGDSSPESAVGHTVPGGSCAADIPPSARAASGPVPAHPSRGWKETWGKVVEPAVRNMDPKEQQELLERIQDTDEEGKYPLLFTLDFQEDMEEVFHNMAAEEDLRVNAMFLGRWVDSQ
ncbi:unnamed protein product, partial [Boreogadus saida]